MLDRCWISKICKISFRLVEINSILMKIAANKDVANYKIIIPALIVFFEEGSRTV